MNHDDSLTHASISPESPWLGLRSFSENAQAYFFGRTEELDDLYERIIDRSLTVLFGQSGLGKSSLLQAALIPRLRHNDYLPVLIRLDHDSDAVSLERQLLDALHRTLTNEGFSQQSLKVTEILDSQAHGDDASKLWLLFHDPSYEIIPSKSRVGQRFPRPVFLIDQFEEIFTLGDRQARKTHSHAFRESLACLVENRPPVGLRELLECNDELAERLDYRNQQARVLISLREDFLHMLERWRRTMPSLMENRLELRMLSGPQAFQAVVKPGQMRPGLPPIIPDQVGEDIVRFVADTSPDTPLEEIDAVPPLLSLICSELNSQRLASRAMQISQSQFEGNSTDILASFYRRSFELDHYGTSLQAAPNAKACLTQLKSLIEDRLLSADGFRESIAFDTIAKELGSATDPNVAKLVLDEIVQRRLLTVEERGGVRRIELAHDVLTRIVKSSRDERYEEEAIERAEAEVARVQAETARIVRERNRLSRLAILSTIFALVAAISAVVGWWGFHSARVARDDALEAQQQAMEAKKQSDIAQKQAIAAKDRAIDSESIANQEKQKAQDGFESAWQGLLSLYNDYKSNSLENTPGLNPRQANLLKSQLRTHLLSQLEKLRNEQPDHRGIGVFIVKLMLDEGREAIVDSDDLRAKSVLDKVISWWDNDPPENADEAEILADAILELARAISHSDQPAAVQFAEKKLPQIREWTARWPESWRLEFVTIRLLNLTIVNIGTREQFSALAKQMEELIERSGSDFDVVLWCFNLRENSLKAKFEYSDDDYESSRQLIAWFRKNIVNQERYSLTQREWASTALENSLVRTSFYFVQPNTSDTKKSRRAILEELETTVSVFESVLPKSINIYSLRGKLLRLQEDSIDWGINTRSVDELKVAVEKHRMVAAALGIATSIAELIAPAFESYLDSSADDRAKELALNRVRSAVKDFMLLDLVGMTSVLNSRRLEAFCEPLLEQPSRDGMRLAYEQMLQRYIELYEGTSLELRTTHVNNFCLATRKYTAHWSSKKETKRFVNLWDKVFKDIPIESNSDGDKSSLVYLYKNFMVALYQVGRNDDAMSALRMASALSEKILTDRPWDWFLEDAYSGLCFEAARMMDGTIPTADIQDILRKGWKIAFRRFGNEELEARYPVLPLKGELPVNVNEEDRDFFSNVSRTKAKITRFNEYCHFDGVKYPYHLYIPHGKNGYNELLNQFKWVEIYHGGAIPEDTKESFKRLHSIAEENKVDFRELCFYAVGTGNADLRKPQASNQAQFDKLLEKIQGLMAAPNAASDKEKQKEIAEVADPLSYLALNLQKWAVAEIYGKITLQVDATALRANCTFCLALLYQGKKEAALQLLQDNFDWPELIERVVLELDQLEQASIKCDDATWFRDNLQLLDHSKAILSLSATCFDKHLKTKSRAERNTEKVKVHDIVLRAIVSNHFEPADKVTEQLASLEDANPKEFAWRILSLYFRNKKEDMEAFIQAHADDAILGESIFSILQKNLVELETKGMSRVKTLPMWKRTKLGLLERALKNKESMEAEALAENATRARKNKVALAFNQAADSGLHVGRPSDAEALARSSISLGDSNTAAYGTLIEALILQGKYSEGLELCKQHWSDPLNGKTLGEILASDFSALAEFGITHPDTQKLLSETSQARP